MTFYLVWNHLPPNSISKISELNPSKKILIIAAAYKMHPNKVRPFVHSFRNTFTADEADLFLLLTVDQESEYEEIRNRYLVNLVLQKIPPGTIAKRYRYSTTIKLLKKLLAWRAYFAVILTDSRDVLFQGNPFISRKKIDGLLVSAEGPLMAVRSIGSQTHNTRWIRNCYGPSMFEQLRDAPISCSGVTIGDPLSILQYSELINAAFFMASDSCKRSSHGDQGSHNVVLHYFGRNDPYFTLNISMPLNGVSPILTAGFIKREDYRVSKTGNFILKNNFSPSIIHQYDRLPEAKFLTEFTMKKKLRNDISYSPVNIYDI